MLPMDSQKHLWAAAVAQDETVRPETAMVRNTRMQTGLSEHAVSSYQFTSSVVLGVIAVIRSVIW